MNAVRRLMWGRSRAESLALAEAEAAARHARLLARADENGCYIVLDTKAECSYCETHRKPILPGESDTDHLSVAPARCVRVHTEPSVSTREPSHPTGPNTL